MNEYLGHDCDVFDCTEKGLYYQVDVLVRQKKVVRLFDGARVVRGLAYDGRVVAKGRLVRDTLL